MIDAETISRAIHLAQLFGFLLGDFILLFIAWKITHSEKFHALEIIATERDGKFHPDQHKINNYAMLILGFTVVSIYSYKTNPATTASEIALLYSAVAGWFVTSGIMAAKLRSQKGMITTDPDGTKTEVK